MNLFVIYWMSLWLHLTCWSLPTGKGFDTFMSSLPLKVSCQQNFIPVVLQVLKQLTVFRETAASSFLKSNKLITREWKVSSSRWNQRETTHVEAEMKVLNVSQSDVGATVTFGQLNENYFKASQHWMFPGMMKRDEPTLPVATWLWDC